jgi:hypothetical protein
LDGKAISRKVEQVRLRGSIEYYNELCNGCLEAASLTYNIYIFTHFHTCMKALYTVP